MKFRDIKIMLFVTASILLLGSYNQQVNAQIVIGGSGSVAKGPGGEQGLATIELNNLKNHIVPDTLTAAQEKKVFAHLLTYAKKRLELQNKVGHPDSVTIYRKRLMCEQVLGVKEFLTDKQYKAYRTALEKQIPWLQKELEKFQSPKAKQTEKK